MHGTESKNGAELRSQSFRGLFRFWYRALYGSFAALPELRNEESADWGASGRSSPVRLKLVPGRPRLSAGNLLPHKDSDKAEIRGAVVAGHNFQLMLERYPWSGSTDLQKLAWPCWLACALGGFGNRARRGAGSVRIVSVKPDVPGMPDFSGCADLDVFVERLSSGLRSAKEFARRSPREAEGAKVPPPFPTLFHSSAPSRVVVAGIPAQDEVSARSGLMLLLRDYKDPFFGLPLRLEDKLLRGRFASPLWASIHKTGTGFAVVLTLFPGGHVLEQAEVNRGKADALISNLLAQGAHELGAL